jgi:hypothetical protein
MRARENAGSRRTTDHALTRSRSESLGYPVGDLPGERRHDVAVDVGRGSHLAVAKKLHHDPRMDVCGEQQRRCGVPSVAQADMPDADAVEQLNPDA